MVQHSLQILRNKLISMLIPISIFADRQQINQNFLDLNKKRLTIRLILTRSFSKILISILFPILIKVFKLQRLRYYMKVCSEMLT